MYNPHSFDFYNRDSVPYLASVELPLPNAQEYFQTSYDMAWSEILTYCAAIISLHLVVMIVKSFIL